MERSSGLSSSPTVASTFAVGFGDYDSAKITPSPNPSKSPNPYSLNHPTHIHSLKAEDMFMFFDHLLAF